jgi:hypothetical protein
LGAPGATLVDGKAAKVVEPERADAIGVRGLKQNRSARRRPASRRHPIATATTFTDTSAPRRLQSVTGLTLRGNRHHEQPACGGLSARVSPSERDHPLVVVMAWPVSGKSTIVCVGGHARVPFVDGDAHTQPPAQMAAGHPLDDAERGPWPIGSTRSWRPRGRRLCLRSALNDTYRRPGRSPPGVVPRWSHPTSSSNARVTPRSFRRPAAMPSRSPRRPRRRRHPRRHAIHRGHGRGGDRRPRIR